ncbi:sensor histidine kinase, partial [Salinisphaera sp.]|uniref:sensor histidine kinase n=1 Tax=Salinisphaera sp. TaxID=1914330 RepID=UPI002D786096
MSMEMEKEELEYRLRQQSLVSEMGLYALESHRFAEVAHKASEVAAQGVRSFLAKVLEYRERTNDFLVYAGVGWREGVVGRATVGAGVESPAGYALYCGEPVLANHLSEEARFRTPQLLADHGVERAINVIIQGHGRPFGVLEADTVDDTRFDSHDTAFLQAIANVLALGLERRDAEHRLARALEDKSTLLDELNHRVKNNLQVVSNLLTIETRRLGDPAAQARFRTVNDRVSLLGRIHNHLYRSGHPREIELDGYVGELCENLSAFYADAVTEIRLDADTAPIHVDLESAIPLSLIINELIANSAEHAFPEARPGAIEVALRLGDGWLTVTVADDGRG